MFNWQKAILLIVGFLFSVPVVSYFGGYYYDICLWILGHSMSKDHAETFAGFMGLLYAIGVVLYTGCGAGVLFLSIVGHKDIPPFLLWMNCKHEPDPPNG